jgi:HK97 family phage portal protein
MGFFDKIFNRNKPNKAMTGKPGWPFSFLFGGTAAGKYVNETTAMQTSAVYACVRILAEAIASLPLHVYEREGDGGKKLQITHPLYKLLHDEPNKEMTSFIWRETIMSHVLIWGNAYSQIIRGGHGHPIALYPLLPDKMVVERNANGDLVYTYYRDEHGPVKLSREQVLHIPGLGFDGLVGYSPIAMAKNAIGMALATEEYGAKFFGNGANPSGVLEHPGTIKDVERVRESWNEKFGGTANAHNVAVLEEGMKFHQISIPPEQAQFLETRKYQISEIARIFRVPPHMVGDLDKSSFSNIEQQSLEFVMFTLNPWIRRFEDSLSQGLLLPSEKGRLLIRFNVDGLLRGNYESRMKGYAIGRQNGWLSANDIRSLEKMNLLPTEKGGDLYMVNGNMVTLESRMLQEELIESEILELDGLD